jgi:hypothetical protein
MMDRKKRRLERGPLPRRSQERKRFDAAMQVSHWLPPTVSDTATAKMSHRLNLTKGNVQGVAAATPLRPMLISSDGHHFWWWAEVMEPSGSEQGEGLRHVAFASMLMEVTRVLSLERGSKPAAVLLLLIMAHKSH